MIRLTLERPWLDVAFETEMPVLSWAINRPGLVRAQRILWREVRNADLPVDLDVEAWLASELKARGAGDAVTFLTSRDIRAYTESTATVEDVTARAIATVGFSNAERVGHRIDRSGKDWGTVNVALCLSEGLTEAARLETMSIVVQARTAAIVDASVRLPPGLATGTGTDCVAVAAPEGQAQYAGLHTAIGEAVGRAVYDAVWEGAQDWIASNRTGDIANG